MKTLLIAALLTMAGWSGQVTVAAAAPTERQTQCDRQWNALPPTDPVRAPGYDRYLKFCLADCPGPVQHEDRKAYGERSRDYCEVRWKTLADAQQTGGQTQDAYVDPCQRRCVAAYGDTGNQLGLILGGVGALALVGGVAAAASHHGSPAEPPASP